MTIDSMVVTRVCTKCEKSYPETAEFFRRHAKGRNGLYAQCRPCTRAANRTWNKGRPEYSRGYAKAWKSANPERVRLHKARERAQRRGATEVDNFDFSEILGRDGPECAYCAQPIFLFADNGGEPAELDHLLPISRGGAHSIENCVLCCGTCNGRKYTRTPSEFIHYARLARYHLTPNRFVLDWVAGDAVAHLGA